MGSYFQKQLIIGILVGILLSVLTYILLGGKRSDLAAIEAASLTLSAEVQKGLALKANYEKLKQEVDQQNKIIDDLIRIMPLETDIGEMPYRIKKMADDAGIDQVSFTNDPPVRKEYYTEFPIQFQFKSNYHAFGQFSSLVSGYEKIISLADIKMKRETRPFNPIAVSCRISAFVYTPPAPPAAAAKPAAAPTAKTSGSKED